MSNRVHSVDAFGGRRPRAPPLDAVMSPTRKAQDQTDETVPLLVNRSRFPFPISFGSRQSTRQFTIADAIDYIGKRFR